jgi:adenine-specific DNA-methyltransferase
MSTRAQNEKKFGQWDDRILKAKRADAAADTAGLEREIDERVYRLYGLTADEIKIVEDAGK